MHTRTTAARTRWARRRGDRRERARKLMDQSEQAFLRSVFLMDAWDMVGGLEGALAALSRGERAADDDEHPLLMLTHKLRGAAALQGLTQVSGLAAALQDGAAQAVHDPAPASD